MVESILSQADFAESPQGSLWTLNTEKAQRFRFSVTIVAMKTSLQAVLEASATLFERVLRDSLPFKESVTLAMTEDLPDVTKTLEVEQIAASLAVDSILLTSAPRSPLSAEITMSSDHLLLLEYTIDSHFLPDGQFLGINIES